MRPRNVQTAKAMGKKSILLDDDTADDDQLYKFYSL